ncbi:MAG: DUF1501 domain-containing protein [Oligoflexia bacterium]|nr:DUF1501 domain-containing protein [Oligoflexia bacterium]
MNKQNNGLNRRNFLKYSTLSALGFIASATVPASLGKQFGVAEGLLPEALAASSSDHTFVYVFCRGGLDALSWLPPSNKNARLRNLYEKVRPNIKYDASSLGDYAFGLNPALGYLKQLYDSKDLSFIYGIGSINETTSHFNQMDYIEGGHSEKRLSTGFFQRLAATASWTSGTDLTAIEATMPRSLTGNHFVFQYRNPASLSMLTGAGVTAVLTKEERLNNNYHANAHVRNVAQAFSTTSKDVHGKVKSIPLNDAPFRDMAELSRLIRAGVYPKVATISVGGWDFHSSLKSRFLGNESPGSGLGGKFEQSLKRLVDDIKAAGRWKKTTIVVMSEFGRRMVENGSLGCDHGRGGIALVLGGNIQGGKVIMKNGFDNRMADLIDEQKTAVVQQSCIPVDYDYRVLLTEIFEKRFGLARNAVVTSVFAETSINGLGSLNLLRA